MRQQIRQAHGLQRFSVRSPQIDFRRNTRVQRFLPARYAEAPAVAVFKATKVKLWPWRAEVVTARFGELQKIICNLCANHMRAYVLWPGFAAAVTEEAGHGVKRAGLELAA